MTKDEKNRKIAEWLGLTNTICTSTLQGPSVSHDHACIEPRTHMNTAGVMDWELPHRCKCGYIWDSTPSDRENQHPPDFFTSEEASALVLDRLLTLNYKITDTPHNFQWAWNDVAKLVMKRIVWNQNNDRKTAIAEAALDLIQQEKNK